VASERQIALNEGIQHPLLNEAGTLTNDLYDQFLEEEQAGCDKNTGKDLPYDPRIALLLHRLHIKEERRELKLDLRKSKLDSY
jgi:hypothetical protein